MIFLTSYVELILKFLKNLQLFHPSFCTPIHEAVILQNQQVVYYVLQSHVALSEHESLLSHPIVPFENAVLAAFSKLDLFFPYFLAFPQVPF